METLDIFFDETDSKPMLLGVFPAHITSFKPGRETNNAIPFNLTLEIAEEAAGFEGTNPITGETDTAKHMVGREVRSVGIWLNKKLEANEQWKNRNYVNLLLFAGIELPEKDGKVQIAKPSEEEMFGRPVMVVLKQEVDKRDLKEVEEGTKTEDEVRKYTKAFSFMKWEGGKRKEQPDASDDIFADLK